MAAHAANRSSVPAAAGRSPLAWFDQSRSLVRRALLIIASLSLASGLVARYVVGAETTAYGIWVAGIVPVLLALLAEIVVSLREGEAGLDIVAALSMSGSILVGEPLAGIVVALMYSGGQYLEIFAQQRARREITALLDRVAHTAMRYRDDVLEETPIDEITPGDRLLIRRGEVIPVDGIAADPAVIDQSALTGESIPLELAAGSEILSGTTLVGDSFTLTAVRPAAESAYARIVALVKEAGEAKAPMTRLADRYAIYFLIVTVAAASIAWIISGDPVRALAVLVVATPCPLILAVPAALVSGVSASARLGLLVKSGSVLEALAGVKVLVADKTGTVTQGEAQVIAVEPGPGFNRAEILRLAASLDQASQHVTAAAIIQAARQDGLALSAPSGVIEAPGRGVSGLVDGHQVIIGSRSLVAELVNQPDLAGHTPAEAGTAVSAIAVDGRFAGDLILADRIRPDARATFAALHRLGVSRVVLASGDAEPVARAIGAELGVDQAYGALSPGDKVDLVLAERAHGPVLMVGDGVNDAPALAAADIGIAMGVRGAAASTEVANAVLLVDRIDPVAGGVAVAQRALLIALQSVIVGMGLSFVAMGFAMFGFLPPVPGALVQEVIDVIVILNALRVGLPQRQPKPAPTPAAPLTPAYGDQAA